MINRLLCYLCLTTLAARADEFLPVLKVNGDAYSNVTVTAVTATDVLFTYTNGVGNAKLKNLAPELQKHFHYDAAKSAQVEKQEATNNILYHQYALSVKPPPAVQEESQSATSGDDDFVAPKLYARSVRGQVPPPFVIEKWLTSAPDITGKFVLIEYWAAWDENSRLSIPELNYFYQKYHDRLAVIGLTAETESAVRGMTGPQIEYAVAIDSQARMMKALEITGIPHCILVDPHSIVRYEGMPGYLDKAKLEHFLDKYK